MLSHLHDFLFAIWFCILVLHTGLGNYTFFSVFFSFWDEVLTKEGLTIRSIINLHTFLYGHSEFSLQLHRDPPLPCTWTHSSFGQRICLNGSGSRTCSHSFEFRWAKKAFWCDCDADAADTALWDKTRSFWDIESKTFPRALEWVNEWCERTSKWMSEWPNTYVLILGCSEQLCTDAYTDARRAKKGAGWQQESIRQKANQIEFSYSELPAKAEL